MRHDLVELGLKVHRGFVTERAVEPRAVVKHFYPFKDRGPGRCTGHEVRAMNQAAFDRAPEAFHERVVIAVASAAHAGSDTRQSQPLPVSSTVVLNTAIGVMHHPLLEAGVA